MKAFYICGVLWRSSCVLCFFLVVPESYGSSDVLNVSSFMMTPKATWADVQDVTGVNVDTTETFAEDGSLGFRVFHLRSSVRGKKQAALDLAAAGIIESGDILLSFRPLWDRTLAYAHMQLGISHSSIAFVVREGDQRFVMTLESPISYSSPLNYPEHYADLDAIHVVRPTLEHDQKTNLERWARLILNDPERFRFFGDYSMPMYRRGMPEIRSPIEQVEYLAQVALGVVSGPFESYCSEFVWSVFGLRNCSPSTFEKGCISPMFDTASGMLPGIVPQMVNGAGLVQGPEAALVNADIPDLERRAILTGSVFVDVVGDPSQLSGRMSSGHLKVAEDNRGNMKLLNGYYASGEPIAAAHGINSTVTDNVSPTSFLVRSNAQLDGLKYVGTVVFDR